VGAVTSQRVLKVLFYVNILQCFVVVENFTANAVSVAIGDNGNRLIFEIWYLNIIQDENLRKVISHGPKLREPQHINWKHNFKIVMDAVEDYARRHDIVGILVRRNDNIFVMKRGKTLNSFSVFKYRLRSTINTMFEFVNPTL
jgi:hypothetical protein